jgi:hypothetical protein
MTLDTQQLMYSGTAEQYAAIFANNVNASLRFIVVLLGKPHGNRDGPAISAAVFNGLW